MLVPQVSLLFCPKCKSDLELFRVEQKHGEKIKEGTLRCPNCDARFPVVNFIPRFVAQENYADSFGLQWTKHARTQYDSYTHLPISKDRFFNETKWPRKMTGQKILEVGCGSGRFTVHAVSTEATLVSIDYSAAVDANYAINGNMENVLIVQADIYSMPLRQESFDRVFCFGVLQHTPDVRKAFDSLIDPLKSGGKVAIDVYAKRGGLKERLTTKRWLRPITRRLPPGFLYPICSSYVSLMWPLARMIHRIPRVGPGINWRLLIPDYMASYPLTDGVLREWAILDCFDMLSPTYDNPQTIETVTSWFSAERFGDIEVAYGYNGIEARATKR